MVKIEIKYTKLFINNEWVDAVSKKTFPTVNPQDETVITQVAEGDKADINIAVEAAVKAFHRYSEWRLLDASQRGRLLLKLADLIERDAKYLGELETLDIGKPIVQATGEASWSAQIIRHYAGKADKILANAMPANAEVLTMTLKEPVGVCGHILPRNYSIHMFIRKIAPALAAGCTLVIKPAEQTPLTALALAALVKEAGFPPGVVNVVPGFGVAGAALTAHPKVNKIAFTGSTEVGRNIMEDAAEVNLKRVTLELGGDTDIANSAVCRVAGTRIYEYVMSDIYDKLVVKEAKTQLAAETCGMRYKHIYLPEPLSIGSRIVFTGTPSVDLPWFTVNIGCGDLEPARGDVAVHFNVRMPERYVVRNTRRHDIWGAEETTASRLFPFKIDQSFSIEILVNEKETRWAVDGEHYCSYTHRDPSPLNAIWVEVGGIRDAVLAVQNTDICPTLTETELSRQARGIGRPAESSFVLR